MKRIHGKFGPAVLAELGVSCVQVEAIGHVSVEKYIYHCVSFFQHALENLSLLGAAGTVLGDINRFLGPPHPLETT